MDEYLSEKEKLEQVTGWLKVNGPWILAGVAVGVLGISGWRWWQNRVDQQALDAASRYEQVVRAFARSDRRGAQSLIESLRRDHAGSPYVDQADLLAARVSVEANELQSAASSLTTVMNGSHDPELAQIARVRLARVQISEGHSDEALATLAKPMSGAFAARYHEVRGDALAAKSDSAGALKEYLAARSSAGPTLAENDVLNLKINDLSAPTAAATPAPTAAATPAPAAAPAPAPAKAAGK